MERLTNINVNSERNVTIAFGQVTKQLLFQFWQIQTRHHKMTVEKILSVLVTKYQAVTFIVKGSD
jgi:hypothetical protein